MINESAYRKWMAITAAALVLSACGGGSGSGADIAAAKTQPPAVFSVVTLTGTAGAGYQDGSITTALFNSPTAVALDSAGNIYISDTGNHVLRKITPAGVVSTVAGQPGVNGYQDGQAAAALFDGPAGLTIGRNGNLYVADANNHQIRQVTPAGQVSTVDTRIYVDQVDQSFLALPQALLQDSGGNIVLSDAGLNKIKKITPDYFLNTIAGNGQAGFADCVAGDCAGFSHPRGIAQDASGNLYVSDTDNQRIRKITPAGVVTTLAGSGVKGYADGLAANAMFDSPWGIAVDSKNNVYVADQNNHVIRQITPSGQVSTVAGIATQAGSADGAGLKATFESPAGLAIDKNDNLYVTDSLNHNIRLLVLQ